MRKYITHQNLDLNTQDPETIWKAIFSNLTCLLQKCKFHKFTFNSRVCFIKLSEGINIFSFAKTQSLALSFIGQKILMCGIVSLNFFSYWSWENFNSNVGKSSRLVLSYKNYLQFLMQQLLPNAYMWCVAWFGTKRLKTVFKWLAKRHSN